MKGIRYICPLYDPSGYGEASRNYIIALNNADVPLTLERVQFDPTEKSMVGKMGEVLESLKDKDIEYDVNVIQLIPEFFQEHKVPGKINIGLMYWETSLLPDDWVNKINDNLDAMFVVCDYTKQSFLDSGVTIPIHSILPAVDPAEFKIQRPPLHIINEPESTFKFYSIFQWTERKNPEGLIKAYLSEFNSGEKVILILKTYVNANAEQSKQHIKGRVDYIKSCLKLDNYPPILLICTFLSREDMLSLHALGDCFVLAHRSEGLGLPHLEAMMMGNPTVATELGGNTEFMHHDNSYLISYNLTPVCNEPWLRWYTGKMEWAEPNLSDLRTHMKYIYENQEEASRKALVGQEYVMHKYNYDVAANSFIDAVKSVEKEVKKNGLKNPV